jgi:hypothetical protein
MTSFVLMVSIITAYGGVTTQRQTGFASYQDCAVYGAAWADTQRDLNPSADLKWQCEGVR